MKKIAFIGPGIMPIPPKDHGAVEILIYQYSVYLEKMGHEVTIYNDRNLAHVAEQINNTSYDIVHLHYDEYVPYFIQALKQPFLNTTHFGYIKERWMWGGYYDSIFDATLKSPGVICLSDEIKQLYLNHGYKNFIHTLRNGAEVESFRFTTTPKYPNRYVCVGKIDTRKRQAELADAFGRNGIEIDFVGPIAHGNFVANGSARYLGCWTKPELYENLTDYGGLILVSDGEACPLVVKEALAAGLNIVVTPTAAANLDDKPYIKVLKGQTDIKELEDFLGINSFYRKCIRQYAEERFDWSVICKEYMDIVNLWNMPSNE